MDDDYKLFKGFHPDFIFSCIIHNCSHFHIFSVVRLYSGKIDTIYVDSKDLRGFDCNDQYLGSRWEDRATRFTIEY